MIGPSPPEPESPNPESIDPGLVIVGASARAAAFSALRSGMQPVCFDQFADGDLRAVAPVTQVAGYPGGLIEEMAPFAGWPVLYTGALENHPDVLQVLDERHALLGNDAATVSSVRDPHRVQRVLKRFRIPYLNIHSDSHPPAASGEWLLKPLHGSAGRGVTIWNQHAANSPTLGEPHYFQRRAHGEACSAVFLAQQDPFQCRYVGLTQQLIGLRELNAPPFRWCGSIGPLVLDTEAEILIRRTGIVLAQQFGLKGLFGCDFIIESSTRPLLTEVNPRYTASVEVIEALAGLSLVREHCQASGYEVGESSCEPLESRLPIVGKVVVYSDGELVVPDTSHWACATPWHPFSGYADVPSRGAVIPEGGPICSILAEAETKNVCLEYLFRAAAEVLRALKDANPDS